MQDAPCKTQHCALSKVSNVYSKADEGKVWNTVYSCHTFGITETINSLREIGEFFGIQKKVEEVIEEELESIMPRLQFYREKLRGKRAMIYVGAPRVWHWIPLMRDLE